MISHYVSEDLIYLEGDMANSVTVYSKDNYILVVRKVEIIMLSDKITSEM